MKILFVMMGKLSVGGIESIVFGLWKELISRGNVIDFVCHGYDIGSLEKDILEGGSKIYHIPAKGENFYGTKREFTKIIQNGNYDVVHSHMNATSGIYLKIAKKYGVKVLVAHSHASTTNAVKMSKLKALINEYEKFPTNKYSNVKIACSDKAGKWLFKDSPYRVVMNAINTQKFLYSEEIRKSKREELGFHDNDLVLIHVGSFFECKNHEYLLKIAMFIKEHVSNRKVKLLLVGDGPLKGKIQEKIKQYHIVDLIDILGVRNDVNELLQASDVFLLPSHTEGNPVSLIEAATSGIHCIASEQVPDDIVKYLKKGNIDFLPIDEKDVYKWGDKIFTEYDRIKYKQDMLEELSISKMAIRIEGLYKEILES